MDILIEDVTYVIKRLKDCSSINTNIPYKVKLPKHPSVLGLKRNRKMVVYGEKLAPFIAFVTASFIFLCIIRMNSTFIQMCDIICNRFGNGFQKYQVRISLLLIATGLLTLTFEVKNAFEYMRGSRNKFENAQNTYFTSFNI